MPKISIVIPTYNRAEYVRRALASALEQPVEELEVVVVDDGSTDGTRDIVGEFRDPRIVYIYQENRGATAAFNRGIRASTGDYLGILGSDDWYLPKGLAPLVSEMERRPKLGLVAGGYIFVDDTGKWLKDARVWQDYPHLDVETWLFACPVLFQAALIRKAWLQRLGGVATGLQDWDFGLRLAQAGCEMDWVPELVFCYRMHEGNSVRNGGMVRRESLAVLDSFFATPDLPDAVLALKDRAYGRAHLRGATYGYSAGLLAQAAADLEEALRLDPGLASGRAQALFDLFVARANHPLTPNPYAFLSAVVKHLPPAAAALGRRRHEAIAAAAMARCFDAHLKRDWPVVRRSLIQAISNDPTWLCNRGVLSIVLQAVIGAPSHELVRRAQA